MEDKSPLLEMALKARDLSNLDKPSQRVRVRNTHEKQVHILIDRYGEPHEILPGQIKEMELVLDQIARLRDLRRPGREIHSVIQDGQIYRMGKIEAPLHPLVVEDVGEAPPPRQIKPDKDKVA